MKVNGFRVTALSEAGRLAIKKALFEASSADRRDRTAFKMLFRQRTFDSGVDFLLRSRGVGILYGHNALKGELSNMKEEFIRVMSVNGGVNGLDFNVEVLCIGDK